MLAHDRKLVKLVEDAGFDKPIEPAECLRRLALLLQLKPGVLCHDATWGQGVIRDIDMFYHRVSIDFERKKKHQLALGYAAETLSILPPDHFLARCHSCPEDIRDMMSKNPGELVKLVIASMGEMTADSLKGELIPRVMKESEWRNFWQSARKVLKNDPLFDIPSKKKDPLRLLSRHEELYGRVWFQKLSEERNIKSLVESLEECIDSGERETDDAEINTLVAERLNFITTGAKKSQPDMVARALIIADKFSIASQDIGNRIDYDYFHDFPNLKSAAEQIPAKQLRPFLSNVILHSPDKSARIIMENIDQFNQTVLAELIDLLIEAGYEEQLASVFVKAISTRSINAKMLVWVLRNEQISQRWKLPAPANLCTLILRILETERSGEDTMDYKRLRAQCENATWLKGALKDMSASQRREFTQRVMQSAAWSPLDRKSVLAKIIRIDPEMEDVVAPPNEGKTTRMAKATRVTSIRSYNQRARQLEKIINVEIPSNSREIAEARAHGDLRENAEFKSAKERQGLIMKRRGELEQDLRNVEASNFAEANASVCGPGTVVTLRNEDDTTETYTVLGEWDSDQDLGIISSSSLLAERIKGAKTGDAVAVPDGEIDKTVVIAEIAPLPDHIREWIDG